MCLCESVVCVSVSVGVCFCEREVCVCVKERYVFV